MKKKLIYIAPWHASFVKKDLVILSNHFDVQAPKHNWAKKSVIPITFLRQLVYLLSNLRSSHAIIIMFGGYWSFFPSLLSKMFGKKCLIILGGMDCVSFPKLNYGSLRKPVQKWFIKQSYKWSSRLLPVDESLAFSTNEYAIKGEKLDQGFRFHFPKIKTPYTVIPNGFEIVEFEKTDRNSNSFIIVAVIDSAMRYKLKGIDRVSELAKHLPDYTFTIVGCKKELIPENAPSNVRFFEFLLHSEFKHYLKSAMYYLQLSLSEGFPNALGEGMMYGCIPIVSNVGAMPHMIGDTGLVLKSNNLKDIVSEIKQFIQASDEIHLGISARERIITKFPLERREKELLAVIG